MPPSSEAPLRYAIIDRCLRNPYSPYPTMKVLKWEIERQLKTSVSTATIQKDIALMKKGEDEGGYSAPIKFKKSAVGYYYDFDNFPDFTIQTKGLNEKEIEAIEVAAGVLQHFKGIKVNDTFNQAIDKLLSAVDIKKTSQVKTLTNAIQPEETTYMRGMEHFEVFVNSIKQNIPVSFIHYSYDKKLFKSIIIHPYLMKESNKRWYLVGYSEEHHEVRYFGLDRVYDPILIDKKFIANQSVDLRTFFDNKIGLNNIIDSKVEKPDDVILWVSRTMANYFKSMPVHKSQVVEEYGGYGEILVKLKLVPTLELVSLILSYGKHVELLEPKWLRREVEKEIERSYLKYKRNRKQ